MIRWFTLSLLLIVMLLLSSCTIGTNNLTEAPSEDTARLDSNKTSVETDLLSVESDDWRINYLDFQEPEGMRYDGLAFWLVSVLNNQVFLGNTNGFVQYAELSSGEIITKILPQGDTGVFYRATKDGYIFSKSFYDDKMNRLEDDGYILTKSFYDKQMNLLKRAFGPKLGPNDEAWEGQWVNDVADDLEYLLYSEQYALIISREEYDFIKNGLFLHDTTNEQTRMLHPEAEFYYHIEVLPNPDYAFIYFIEDNLTVRSAVLNLTNGELQQLEKSEDMQHHTRNGSRRYFILTNGYYDKTEQAYHSVTPAIPNNVSYVIDDSGRFFYYFDNIDDKLRLVVYDVDDDSMDYLDLSSKYSSGRLIDVAENGSVVVGLTDIKDKSSFGLYQITRAVR